MNKRRCMIAIKDEKEFNLVAKAAKKLGYEFYLSFPYLRNIKVIFLTPDGDAEWSNRPIAAYRNSPYIKIDAAHLLEISEREFENQ